MAATAPIPALLPTYAPYPFPLVRGEGDRVFDDAGQAWWDFYGGHCVCATGHSHPAVVKAVADQAATLLFYSAAALKKHLLANHILVGGSSDPTVLRLMPPLNLSDEALDALIAAIHAFVPEQP